MRLPLHHQHHNMIFFNLFKFSVKLGKHKVMTMCSLETQDEYKNWHRKYIIIVSIYNKDRTQFNIKFGVKLNIIPRFDFFKLMHLVILLLSCNSHLMLHSFYVLHLGYYLFFSKNMINLFTQLTNNLVLIIGSNFTIIIFCLTFQKDLSICNGNNINRNISKHISNLCFNYE